VARSGHFYDVKVVSNTAFTAQPTWTFGRTMESLLLLNLSDLYDVFYSFNGRDIQGRIPWHHEGIELEGVEEYRIWLYCSNSAGAEIEVNAWDERSAITKRSKRAIVHSRSGYDMWVNPDGSINAQVSTALSERNLKLLILCADDVEKDYVWTEIDGVYRLTQWTAESAGINALEGKTVQIVRTYTYEVVDPFNLINRDDQLVFP